MPSEPLPRRSGQIGAPPTQAARSAGPASRPLSLLRRAAKIVGINLLLTVLLLIPLELWFGHWLDGPGAVSMLDANPGRVEHRSSPLYPPGNRITNSRTRYGFRGGRDDPARSALQRLKIAVRGWWQARQNQLIHDEIPITPGTQWEPASLPSDFAASVAPKIAAYRQRLGRLTKLIRDFGAQPIYITQKRMDGRLVDGHWQQIAGSDGARNTATVDAINQATLVFCRDTGETCINLAERIDFGANEFADGIHTNPAGSAHIGRFLARELGPLLCRR